MKNHLSKIRVFLLWLFWDFSGLRFIYEKLFPPFDESKGLRPPITFTLWAIGIYVAFFGIASGRYENRIDIIESRANAIYTQLGTPIYKQAISRIPRTQGLKSPVKPDILNPISVFLSMFGPSVYYTTMVEQLKETVEIWKESLSTVVLNEAILNDANLRKANLSKASLKRAHLKGALMQGAILSETDFTEANLLNANLRQADLTNSYFWRAFLKGTDLREGNLRGADLQDANLENVNLTGADLTNANLKGVSLKNSDLSQASLRGANLQGANLEGATLKGVDLTGANLTGIEFSTIKQLLEVDSLYDSILDPKAKEPVLERAPQLLKRPNE